MKQLNKPQHITITKNTILKYILHVWNQFCGVFLKAETKSLQMKSIQSVM